MAQKNKRGSGRSSMIFDGINYKLLVLGLVLVTGGFTAMYIENKVSGFISLYISPVVIVAGYITVIFAIMVKRTGNHASNSPNAS